MVCALGWNLCRHYNFLVGGLYDLSNLSVSEASSKRQVSISKKKERARALLAKRWGSTPLTELLVLWPKTS